MIDQKSKIYIAGHKGLVGSAILRRLKSLGYKNLIIKDKSIKRIKFSKNYGSIFGRIFQIVDDLIDEENSFKEIGKTPGKDKKQGKRTFLSVIGKTKAKKLARATEKDAPQACLRNMLQLCVCCRGAGTEAHCCLA